MVRSSFTVAAIAAPALKTINLPKDLVMKPAAAQIQCVADLNRHHFDERDGELPLFGEILGYGFVNAYDGRIRFDTAGKSSSPSAGTS